MVEASPPALLPEARLPSSAAYVPCSIRISVPGSLQLIARHYRRPLGAALCFLRPAFPKSFINHERQARSLRPRRDASLPHPAQRLVASGSTGLERKQSRQSVGSGGGVRLLRAR